MQERYVDIELPTTSANSVGILVFQGTKVLLVRHGEAAGHITGVYGIPSGRVEEGETLSVCAVRELFEETGLRSTEDSLSEYPSNIYIADIERKGGEKIHFVWRVFICNNWDGILLGSDETSPDWFEIEKISTLKLLPNVQKAVHDGMKFLKK